jgi:hypothetical protein
MVLLKKPGNGLPLLEEVPTKRVERLTFSSGVETPVAM